MTISTARPARPSPWPIRFFWVLKALVALVFLLAAFQKFSNQLVMVKDFEEIGLGQGFRYLTAAVEAAGAVLLLWPRAVLGGVVLLTGICAGALVAQIGPLHGDVIHVVVLGGLVIVIGLVDWRSRRRGPREGTRPTSSLAGERDAGLLTSGPGGWRHAFPSAWVEVLTDASSTVPAHWTVDDA